MPGDGRRPRAGVHARTAPAAVAIEPQVRIVPRLGIASRPERAGMRPVHQAVAESLQASGIAEVDEADVVEVGHPSMMKVGRRERCPLGEVAVCYRSPLAQE